LSSTTPSLWSAAGQPRSPSLRPAPHRPGHDGEGRCDSRVATIAVAALPRCRASGQRAGEEWLFSCCL
jgi:hypothetical protein